ncbi:anthranilate phosphoribosyltransferase [Cardiobacteriaceae bacterium TAE3-ERU3]|nr:anthranilate phosphoribosyltransferase [Cardiobacteriaceae bacterium TAE3-ERU3]
MKEALGLLAAKKDLPAPLMRDVVTKMMGGDADPAAIGGLLMGLALKGETVSEVSAAAEVMRSLAKEIQIDTGDDVLVDPVGTGGDGANLFNVSTASALLAAAGGVKIAKHGNIAASSSSGSADVLREAGLVLDLTPQQVAQCVQEVGFGFMFAQAYHQAMRHVVPVRRALGVRTIYNVLGPLANPAGVRHQVLGVFSKEWVRPMAEVSKSLGSKRILVVHADNGLDEFSVTHNNYVAELHEDGSISEYEVSPKAFGMNHVSHEELQVSSAAESLKLIKSIFGGGGPKVGRDMIALNTAAIFYVAGKSKDLSDGIQKAMILLDNGSALKTLDKIVAMSQRLAEENQ